MKIHSTPNLPSRDFDVTEAFYARLGFATGWRDEGWMILRRGDAVIEFFPHPHLRPEESWFSACLRTDDLDALHAEFAELRLPGAGIPRLQSGVQQVADELRMFAVIDPDGSLIRCLGA